VKGFKFQGNKLISNEVLQQFVKKYIGKNLTIEDLQNIAAEIGGFYRDSGYLAVAGLPKQDVTEGIITIDIQESHFGGVLLLSLSKTVSL
jgi:Hemolysin activation/secretion protein